MSSSRPVATKALWAAATTLLALLAIEGACRFFGPGPPGHIDLPAKDAGSYRILILGGSTIVGLPVPELGLVAQLEAALRRLQPEKKLEVVNLGLGGRGSEYVRKILERTIDAGPDLIIVLTAHNEFLLDEKAETAARRTKASPLRHLALVRTIERRARKWRARRLAGDDVMPRKLSPYDRGSPWFRGRIEAYRANLAGIVQLARSRNVPLLVCTAPWNMADWAPVHRYIAWAVANPNYEADIAQLKELIEAGRLTEAEVHADRLLEKHGDDAMVLYLKGRICRLSGRGAQARALFVRAKDLDPYPWRVLSEFNDAVRAAARHDGVAVVDLEAAFACHARDGLVGFELVGDNVHPTPLGSALAAREIAGAMAAGNHFLSRDATLGTTESWVTTFLSDIEEGKRRRLLVKVLLKNASYSMKTPFYNFSASRRRLEQALELEPRDWRIWANLGTLALLEGRRNEGQEQIQKAAALKGSPLDPWDRRATPYLKEAVARAGVSLE